MDFLSLIFFGVLAGYLALLVPAFLEADRKTGADEPFWPAGPKVRPDSFSYWFMVAANGLLFFPAVFLTFFAFMSGPLCGFGGVLCWCSPSVAFFVALTRKSAKSDKRWLRVLWRFATYFGIVALMIGLGVAACSVQAFKFEH